MGSTEGIQFSCPACHRAYQRSFDPDDAGQRLKAFASWGPLFQYGTSHSPQKVAYRAFCAIAKVLSMVNRTGAPRWFTNQAINQLLIPLFIACEAGAAHHLFGSPQNFTGRTGDSSLFRRCVHLCNSAGSLMTFKNSMHCAPNSPLCFPPAFCSTDSLMNALFDHTLNLALMRVARGGLSWQVKTQARAFPVILILAIN